MQKPASRWQLNSGSDGAAVQIRRIRHSFAFAITGSKTVIVTAEDTDVMMLCHAFQKDIPCPICEQCGTQNRVCFLDIKLAWSLGDSTCDSLVGLHAFTGCYTVSTFASRGKLSAMKLMKIDITYQETLSQVGQSWGVQPQPFEKVPALTAMVCQKGIDVV